MVRVSAALLVGLASACGGKANPAGPQPAAAPAAPPGVASGDVCSQTHELRKGNVFLVSQQARAGSRGPRFSDQRTSPDSPVEVCNVNRQLDLLMELRCDDGSAPFADREAAHAARHGSIGSAGRCKVPVDLYRVPCPEKTYGLHFDIHMCTLGEVGREGPYLTRFVDAGYTALIPVATLPTRTKWGLHVQGDAYMISVAADLAGEAAPFEGESTVTRLRSQMSVVAPEAVETTAESYGTRSEYAIIIGNTQLEVVELTLPSSRRVVMLARRADDSKAAALEAKLPEIANGFVANDHRHLTEEELFTPRSDRLDIEVDEVAGSTYVYPQGWKVVYTSKDRYVARTETKDGSLSFIQHRVARKEVGDGLLSDLFRRLLRSETITLHYFSSTAFLVEGDDSFNMTIVLPADDQFVVGTLGASPVAFRANDGALLLKMLVTMTQTFILDESAP